MAEKHRLRDGSEVEDPRLDRLMWFDEQSRDYPIGAVVPADVKSKTWEVPGVHLDQGVEGACVGFGVAHELAAYPFSVKGLDDRFAREQVYWEAQKIDPWEGGAYPGASPRYEGTAVLAGMKIAKRLGYIAEYRWAFSVDDVLRAVSHEGPVVVGTKWLEGMDSPAASSGLLTVDGSPRGGHCYVITGVTLRPKLRGVRSEPVFRLRNSWGARWGRKGDAFMYVDDFERLLLDGGEAVVPLGRSKKPQIAGVARAAATGRSARLVDWGNVRGWRVA